MVSYYHDLVIFSRKVKWKCFHFENKKGEYFKSLCFFMDHKLKHTNNNKLEKVKMNWISNHMLEKSTDFTKRHCLFYKQYSKNGLYLIQFIIWCWFQRYEIHRSNFIPWFNLKMEPTYKKEHELRTISQINFISMIWYHPIVLGQCNLIQKFEIKIKNRYKWNSPKMKRTKKLLDLI